MTGPPRPRFVLVLEPAADPDGLPPVLRLRRLLKYALRACRLRCVSATEETPLTEGVRPDGDRHQT